MNRLRALALAITVSFVGACDVAPPPLLVEVHDLEPPAGPRSGEPFLAAGGGAVYLTWLEASPEGGHDLLLSPFRDGDWGPAKSVTHSERFFVNWADFPSVSVDHRGRIWVHWLERGGAGTYDYDG